MIQFGLNCFGLLSTHNFSFHLCLYKKFVGGIFWRFFELCNFFLYHVTNYYSELNFVNFSRSNYYDEFLVVMTYELFYRI